MGLWRRLFGNTKEEAPKQEPVKQHPVVTPTVSQAATSASAVDGASGPVVVVATDTATPDAEVEVDSSVDDELLDPTTRPLGVEELQQPPPAEIDGKTRRLEEGAVAARKSDHILFGQASDVGLVRTNNQDSAISFFVRSSSVEEYPAVGLFVVADGMGGHHDGEKASAITTRVLANQVATQIFLPLYKDNHEPTDRPPHAELLTKAIQEANKEVIANVPDGGTTVTALLVVGDWLHVAHVGDSRAYLISEEGIEQITRDHSLVQRLIELDQLTPEEAANHPKKNVLYRALGQNETLEVDLLTRRLPPDSRLLVCSDGLWGLVEEKDLYEVSMNTPDPQKACEKLIELANIQGGIDNITAIILNIT